MVRHQANRRYTVAGSHLEYVDDAGFTATGDIRGGVLFHEHLVLYKEQQA
ncbi:Atu4866 domain-containing protein [Streptomyces sp. RK76]|nr:Atu4866 domain-containing protein [Streptomyces sp. RK76]